MNKHINWNNHLDRLISLRNTPDSKVITAIRHSGKSMFLQDYIECIKENDPDHNIVFINILDIGFEKLKEYHTMHSFVFSKYNKDKNNYWLTKFKCVFTLQWFNHIIHWKNNFYWSLSFFILRVYWVSQLFEQWKFF